MKKLFVSNFGDDTSITQLATLFVSIGQVAAIRMHDGKYGPFAVVEMPSDWEADDAIAQLNGEDLNDQPIKVKEAKW